MGVNFSTTRSWSDNVGCGAPAAQVWTSKGVCLTALRVLVTDALADTSDGSCEFRLTTSAGTSAISGVGPRCRTGLRQRDGRRHGLRGVVQPSARGWIVVSDRGAQRFAMCEWDVRVRRLRRSACVGLGAFTNARAGDRAADGLQLAGVAWSGESIISGDSDHEYLPRWNEREVLLHRFDWNPGTAFRLLRTHPGVWRSGRSARRCTVTHHRLRPLRR